MRKYTQEECYKILYDYEMKRLTAVELRPDGIHPSKWSRLANISAVKHTWELFNKQEKIPDDIDLIYTKL